MAILQSTNISDTGYLQLPSGTSLQRWDSSLFTITGLGNNTLSASFSGQQLYITPSLSVWQKYRNLPEYLTGLLTTTDINYTDASNWTIPACRVYMLRNPAWNAVTVTGWELAETGVNYIDSETNLSVYYRDYAAGTYSFDTNSAMYMFAPPVTSGRIRFNTDRGVVEYYGPSNAPGGGGTNTALVAGTFGQGGGGNSQKGATNFWKALTIPYLVREIITNCYVYGGYKDSVTWKNANRTVVATDTTASLGDLLNISFNYKGGVCGSRRAYAFGAGGTHNASSSNTSGFDMVAEGSITIPSRSNMANSRGQAGVVWDEKRTAWVTGGDVATIEEFDLLTDTFRTAVSKTTFIPALRGNPASGATDQGPWAMSGEGRGIWYSGESTNGIREGTTDSPRQQTLIYPTVTNITRSGMHPGYHHQQKSLPSKLQYSYAGNDGSYAGGTTFRRTNFYTDTTEHPTPNISKVQTNSGEENYAMAQAHGYLLGNHNGAQNNLSMKFTYATETGVAGGATLEPKGSGQGNGSGGAVAINGRSSGLCAWRA